MTAAASLLVVEDDVLSARALERALRAADYDVKLVHSCGDARALVGRFDYAVLDIDLPDGSGVDLASELLRRERVQRVVFYSADLELRERALAIGPFVMKSEPVDRVVEEILRFCSGGTSVTE